METKTTIRNCEIKFRRQCPRNWDALPTSSEPKAKMCGVCRKQVFFCTSDEETLLHAEQGQRVARTVPVGPMLPRLASVEPITLKIFTEEEVTARKILFRELDIESALCNIKLTSQRCANCGYPVPEWWKQCRVCKGTEYQIVETPA